MHRIPWMGGPSRSDSDLFPVMSDWSERDHLAVSSSWWLARPGSAADNRGSFPRVDGRRLADKPDRRRLDRRNPPLLPWAIRVVEIRGELTSDFRRFD